MELIDARFRLRTDTFTPKKAMQQGKDQIAWLKTLPKRTKGCTGTIEVLVSDLMPCGFVALSKTTVVSGIFPAEEYYSEGPMITASRNSSVWEMYDSDWKARWGDAMSKAKSSTRRATGPYPAK